MKSIRHNSRVREREKTLPESALVSETLQREFLRFIEQHPAERFSRNLRKMFLEFLMENGAVEAMYLKDLLYDLDGLFDLLDVIEEETGKEKNGGILL